ncbi:MAG: hypothetical protein ACTHWO_10475 [Nesterenkonia sp.]
MKPSRFTAGAATGLTLALALSACAGGEADNEEPMEPEATQQETMPEESPDETGMDDGDMEDSDATETMDEESMDEGAMDEESMEEESMDDESMDEESTDLSAVMPESTGDPFADARTAAQHMPMTAATLSSGFASALDIPGDAQSEAADVRGQMTALFQEHVYLAGIGVATAYHAGPDSDEFELATETLDANSVALADAVGELAGDDARESFLRNWREHIGYFVDYAVATDAGDEEGMNQAVDDLREYADGVGDFFDRTTDGELPADTVTESFNGHIDTFTAAVDSMAAGDADAFSNLKMASDHIVEGSAVMTEGLTAAAGLEGDPNDEATEVRATLTAGLNEHVYLASTAVFVAYTEDEGTDSEAFDAATQVLDENTVELADAVGELAGDESRQAFLDLWREHIGYFVDYAEAIAGGDDAAAEEALMNLDQYRQDAGEFFEEISAGELPADDIAEGLSMHVQTLSGAIDSLNEALVQNS